MYKGDAKLRWRDPNGIKTVIFSLPMVAPPSVGQDLPTGSPEALGMSTERLARIRPMLQQYVESGTVPGIAAMVARHGKVVYFEVFGQAQVEPSVEMDRSTIFRIYSMTKPGVSFAPFPTFCHICFPRNRNRCSPLPPNKPRTPHVRRQNRQHLNNPPTWQ